MPPALGVHCLGAQMTRRELKSPLRNSGLGGYFSFRLLQEHEGGLSPLRLRHSHIHTGHKERSWFRGLWTPECRGQVVHKPPRLGSAAPGNRLHSLRDTHNLLPHQHSLTKHVQTLFYINAPASIRILHHLSQPSAASITDLHFLTAMADFNQHGSLFGSVMLLWCV